MPSVSQLELEHCKELALLPGSLFEFTSRFVAPPRKLQLLALYALTRSISTIPASGVDDSVKWAKLKWWSDELVADPASPSRHPVLRAMWQSEARSSLGNGLLLRLVNDAVLRIDAMPDADEGVMFERLAKQGETGILLELALDCVEIPERDLASLAAASELFHMLSRVMTSPREQGLILPLDLLARYQINTAKLDPEYPSDDLISVLAYLAGKGRQWFAQASSPDLKQDAGIHMKLRWAMEARQFARISKHTRSLLNSGNRYGPSDAWFAWRLCRRLRAG